MNSQATENLFRKLFSGNITLSEQALLAVAKEDRPAAREIVKVRQDFELLLKLLLSDLGFATGEMKKNPHNQFWRRDAIRVLAVTIDGIVFGLKKVTLAGANLKKAVLDKDDVEFLRECSIGDESKKVRIPPFRDNLKRLFKLFANVQGGTCPTDFGQEGFEALCQTYGLRNRITHPKSFMTYCVQDAERNRAGVAIEWLSDELQRLLNTGRRGMDQSKN